TPGVTTLTVGETALPPQIADATRNIEFPTSSDTITISATITDTAGTVAAANVLLDTGSGYTSIAMNNTTGNTWAAEVGPFDDKTAIRWYIDATNNFGVSQTEPFSAPANGFMFHVQNTPVGKGIVVMNEIAYNPTGPDGGGAEFVELYNNTSEEIDLSGFNFSRGSDNNNFTFPWGTTIAANGYLVLVQNIGGMEALYGEGTVSPMLQWGSWQLLNGGVELRLKHANVMGFSDTPFTAVDYSNTEPWPIITFNPDGSGDGNGRTIELIEPNLDESDPLNWRASLGPIGSPGAVNGTATDVSDWVLFH
ncbi:MAG: lamin tail domain-containing protein, partial [Candidatus Sumerlaeia bacterium]|nr:lamin tail domain-containing protein [Candidatus Sumerlaeia bacterium]